MLLKQDPYGVPLERQKKKDQLVSKGGYGLLCLYKCANKVK